MQHNNKGEKEIMAGNFLHLLKNNNLLMEQSLCLEHSTKRILGH
jgi:hypothetical protein